MGIKKLTAMLECPKISEAYKEDLKNAIKTKK